MTSADVPEIDTPPWPAGTWLGFDFGMRRIGVAVGQTATRTASPLTVARHGKQAPDWDQLLGLVHEWKPVGLVVGLPLGPDGETTPMAKKARAFGEALAKRTGLPLATTDERMTSQAAEREFAARRAEGSARRRDAQQLDAVAASIILSNWLQSLPPDLPPKP